MMLPIVTCPTSRSREPGTDEPGPDEPEPQDEREPDEPGPGRSDETTQTANGMAAPARATRRSSRWTVRKAAGEFSSAQVPRGGVGSHGANHSSLARRLADQVAASDRRYGRRTTPLAGSESTAGQPGGPNKRTSPPTPWLARRSPRLARRVWRRATTQPRR